MSAGIGEIVIEVQGFAGANRQGGQRLRGDDFAIDQKLDGDIGNIPRRRSF